jgi:hypothetical protein
MAERVQHSTPVYFFLGFRLLEATYRRTTNASIKTFGIKIIDSEYNEKNSIHTLTAQFNLTFEKEEESSFVFSAGYLINHVDWYHHMKKEQQDALFFSVVFPFIREKIHSLSNDIRGSIDIPIIDLRQADLSKGAIFTKKS